MPSDYLTALRHNNYVSWYPSLRVTTCFYSLSFYGTILQFFCSDFTQSYNAAALILFTQFVNVDLYCGYQFQQASASNIHIEILDDT